MTQVGTGNRTYELIRDFLKLPDGEKFGLVSRVATDSQDRVYVFQRKDPPVVVFDREGKYLGAWGTGEVTDPHGLKIVDDVVYTTDRSDSVAKSFTLDGKPLLELGQRGVHSDTGCTGAPWLAERAAGPFNHPTEMMAHPNGDIYVTDGYRNARVHRFTHDGQLVTSWGTPGKAPGESRSILTAGSTWPTGQTSASRFFPPTATCSANGPAWAARTTSRAPRTARSSSPSKKTATSRRMSAYAMRTEKYSPAWRAGMSTAQVWTRAATSTPD
jgi:hypothetical protein